MRNVLAFRVVSCALILGTVGIGGEPARAQSAIARNAVLTLDHGWQFRQVKAGQGAEEGWLPAKVPGDVHLDLIANKKIPDPFYRDNEAKLQWISNEAWEYRTTIDIPAAIMARTNVDLVFDGLDAASEVYLNGAKVLDADNMFRVWRVPAKAHLHVGKNELRVLFPPPDEAAEKIAATDPWQPKTHTAPKTYIRKAAYEYGWDWGPTFVTSGIWRPARIEAWNQARISDFAIHQRDVSKEVAHIDAEVDVEASSDGPGTVTVSYVAAGKPVTLTANTLLHAGLNVVDLPAEIVDPDLWYPNGYGKQSMYGFTAKLATAGAAADARTVKAGLRSIVLDRHLDQWGRSFQFVVNGIPVFAKGANVIPFDSFPNRITMADYRRILESARDANMNMIRDWGGGYYETDEFYTLCDELGLMVWQDFMFGNDWQPGLYSWKQNVEVEAEDQVRRLRNHPSIVLWCGNNETEEAFHWHGRDLLPADVRLQMWQDYLTVFSGILPRVVARLDPETPYWPSAPSADYEPVTPDFRPGYHSGDDHVYDVWGQRKPFTAYDSDHSRFVTEYSFQSIPEMRTIEAFTQPEDRTSIYTPVMLAHQKHKEGNSIVHEYMLRYYPEPKDFASYVYVSQVLQAEGVKIGAEHWRRSRPETMGSLFWQLNDCWPVISWSSIDYYGRWKALQYYARRFYAPILVSPYLEDGAVKFYIVSDKTEAKQASLRVRLMDFDGKVLLQETQPVTIAPLASQVYLEWPMKKLTDAGATDTSRVFVLAELSAGGKELSRNLIYLAPVKEIRLEPAKLRVETGGANGVYKIRVSSPVLARSVYLSFGNLDVDLSDNYFDLIPGEPAEITARSKASLGELKAQMKVISLVDAFAPAAQTASVGSSK